MFDAIAGALRSPQSPAERRHRSPLAEARDRVAAADRPRARARSLHRHRRSGDRGACAHAPARRASSASISPARCCASALEKLRRARLDRRDRAGARRRDARSRSPTRRSTPSRSRFGIRNVEHMDAACAEMLSRAEAGRPAGDPRVRDSDACRSFGAVYCWYFNHVLPRIGRLVSRHDAAYGYLPASVGAFASPDEFVKILRQADSARCRAIPLTFGIVYSLYGSTGTRALEARWIELRTFTSPEPRVPSPCTVILL